tara:strand:- start:537 stop:1301 length:765 start_codon:yes stop_codon:yes gene_type:complete
MIFAPNLPRAGALAIAALLIAAAPGCNAVKRMQEVGAPPPLTPVENPTTKPTYRTVSMPMPAPVALHRQANSLWRPGAKAFFKDQRAARVGDILTVTVAIDEEADISNTTTRRRTSSEDLGLDQLFGYQLSLADILPNAVNNADLLDLDSASSAVGNGAVDRAEDITFTIAAVVTQVLPNGNLVIEGRQEMRVNFEVRELIVAGVIRPEDISNANTIAHTQIAEARISYGGRGQLTDVQQPRYGQQVLDIILPF